MGPLARSRRDPDRVLLGELQRSPGSRPGGVDARVAEIAALVDGFVTELTDWVDELADQCGSVQLADIARHVERAVRAGEGASAAVVSSVDRRGLYLDDAHRDAKAWLRANVQMAPTDEARRHRIGRLCRQSRQSTTRCGPVASVSPRPTSSP